MKPKKEAILRTVLDMMTSKTGQKNLTLSNIAKDMGIGKSTIYEYFTTKEEIIKEAMFLMIAENIDYILLNNNPQEKGFKEAFYTHLRRSLEIAKKNQMTDDLMHNVEWIKVSTTHKKEIMERLMGFYEKSKAHMSNIFRIGVEQGILNENDLKESSIAIESLLLGFVIAGGSPFNNWETYDSIDVIYDSVIVLANR